MPRIIPICLLCLALGACASRRAQTGTELQADPSRPNYGSIYYYVVASYLRSQNNYSAADALYRRALDSDPRSHRLKKQVLLNAINLHQAGGIETEELRGLIDEYSREFAFDEELLYACFEFFEREADADALQKTIQEIQNRFPSARASIQRFIFELRYKNNTELRHLDQALQMAHNDPQTLYLLASIYMFYDQDKERQALRRLHEIAPSDDSHKLLRDHIVRANDPDLARDYLSSLEYPADREYMLMFADSSIAPDRYGLLAQLAPLILPTRDLDLLNMLGLSAMLSQRGDVLDALGGLLPGLEAPDRDKQYLRTMLIARSLKAGDSYALDPWMDQLFEASSFDDILAHYNFAVTSDIAADWRTPDHATLEAFKRQITLRLSDGPPSRYLTAIASAVQDSTNKSFVDARHDLLLWLKQRHGLSEGDYEFLLQYYYNQGRTAERRSLLAEAQEEYPENALFNNDLGYSLLLEGADPEKAAALIRRALAVEPVNPYYLDSLAWYHYLIGEYELALDLTAIPQEMENVPAEIAWHIGAIYLKLGDSANARIWLEKCVESGDDPEHAAKAKEALKQLP
ncbi:MAG: hypothetical protein K0B87_00905 [Candidatus Syntrophosphaera sp.]|nr:hypothetical protein [Candidatus Syntrophosphaera sp.]